MSDLPIQPQPNPPGQSPMANISPFASIGSSIISGGFQVWASYIHQDTQLKVASKNQDLERLRNELREASDLREPRKKDFVDKKWVKKNYVTYSNKRKQF